MIYLIEIKEHTKAFDACTIKCCRNPKDWKFMDWKEEFLKGNHIRIKTCIECDTTVTDCDLCGDHNTITSTFTTRGSVQLWHCTSCDFWTSKCPTYTEFQCGSEACKSVAQVASIKHAPSQNILTVVSMPPRANTLGSSELCGNSSGRFF